jgi:hypothetical protein
MHELTLTNLPAYVEREAQLVTVMFSLASVATQFASAVAPKRIDVWIADTILDVNAYANSVLPIGPVEATDYYLVLATTEETYSYVLLPRGQLIQSVPSLS